MWGIFFILNVFVVLILWDIFLVSFIFEFVISIGLLVFLVKCLDFFFLLKGLFLVGLEFLFKCLREDSKECNCNYNENYEFVDGNFNDYNGF